MKRIYLDYAATTPTDPRVLKKMLPYLGKIFGNPSSLHFFGQEAKAAIEEAREKIAKVINAHSEEIVFTSGGTEANNFALKGIAYANKDKGNHIITSSIEHHSVLEPLKFLEKSGFKVTYLKVDKYGLIDLEELKKSITNKTILVSIMQANNEIGTIQPIAEIANVIRNFKNSHPTGDHPQGDKFPAYAEASAGRQIPIFHTDAVQTFGHLKIDVNQLGVDLFSISSHKLYGPKGVGALYIKKGTNILPYFHGGEQEQKKRAGTENVASIVGFAEASQIANKEMTGESKRLFKLRDKLIKGIFKKIKGVRLNGHPLKRLPNNINLGIYGAEGEAMLLALDLEGIACSTGSACSSSSLEPSHVLMAIGLSEELAHSSLRFTLGRFTTDQEIDKVLEILPKIVRRLRKISPIH